MAVTGVSHVCLLIKKVQYVFLWQPHCDLTVVRTTAYLKAVMVVYGKRFKSLGPKGLTLVDGCIVLKRILNSRSGISGQILCLDELISLGW